MSSIRECKCVVQVVGQQGSGIYRETFTTQGRCADHAVHKVSDYLGKYMRSVQNIKVGFKEWLDFEDERRIDVV